MIENIIYLDMESDRNEEKKLFIVTPIGEKGSEIRDRTERVYANAIEPALRDRFNVKVSYLICGADDINQTIMRHLQHDELVIADLTGLNPNVFFEVGYRFALEKDIIFIAEEGTKIPFDVSTRRAYSYEVSDAGFIRLKDYLIEAVYNTQHRGKFQDYEG